MQVILFRHGIAADAKAGQSDAQRPLTSRGIERTMAAAQGLARVLQRPTHILTSPKMRATQTAAILGEVFDISPTIEPTLASGTHEKIISVLRQYVSPEIILVGHEPTLSQLAELLCTRGLADNFIELKKAGCVLIDAPCGKGEIKRRQAGRLIWSLSPRVLRALA